MTQQLNSWQFLTARECVVFRAAQINPTYDFASISATTQTESRLFCSLAGSDGAWLIDYNCTFEIYSFCIPWCFAAYVVLLGPKMFRTVVASWKVWKSWISEKKIVSLYNESSNEIGRLRYLAYAVVVFKVRWYGPLVFRILLHV